VTDSTATGALDFAERAGRRIETGLLCAAIAVMIGLASLQIVMRDAFGAGLGWADEALRVLVLWVGMLGAVVASREHRHLAVDVVSHYLSAPVRRRVLIAVDACTAAICYALSWVSGAFVSQSVQSGERLIDVIPAWIIQSILPIGFFLIAYRYSVWVLRRLKHEPGHGDGTGRFEVPQ
jgi:TRAP-type C4-dicarboxylate transport system permease small subunit